MDVRSASIPGKEGLGQALRTAGSEAWGRVVVTRAVHQAAGLCDAFVAAGAEVARLPLIELAPPVDPHALERATGRTPDFDWLVFTSSNAVDAFLPRVNGPLPRCAAVGPATAGALRHRAVEPALIADRSRAEGLLEVLTPRLEAGARVLLPQAEDARPDLVAGLRAAGAAVTSVVAYRKRLPDDAAVTARRLFARDLGWVTCTSPRIVRHLAEVLADDWPRRRGELRAISIGPVTSAELRRQGVEPEAEAQRPSNRAMVEAAMAVCTSPSPPAARVPTLVSL